MKVAITKERYAGERRVALTPANAPQLAKLGLEMIVESGAGVSAGFLDHHYREKGAVVVDSLDQALAADIIVQLFGGRKIGLRRGHTKQASAGQIVIGSCDPLGKPAFIKRWADSGATLFPLSASAVNHALAAEYGHIVFASHDRRLSRGATGCDGTSEDVSNDDDRRWNFDCSQGLYHWCWSRRFTSNRNGSKVSAVVHAYDVRPACREQVESLGGKFVEVQLDASSSEDKGGYAKAMDEAFYRKQRELMASVVSQSDVVITTAAIPGKQSPLLVTADAVRGMPAGGVIIDLAAERGGNCELTKADQRVVENGVTILGPTNLPSDIPNHASQMLGNNVVKFLGNMIKKGELNLNLEDEIIRETMVVH